jgi:hypothetical protein
MYQIYHTWIHFYHASYLPPPPIPGIVSIGIIFAFSYMYTQYFHHIHCPKHFPHHFSHPIGTHLLKPAPQGRTCSTILLSDCVEEKWKQSHFCLCKRKVATQGVSLWYFQVYMYYNSNWFISILLHSTQSYGSFSLFKNLIPTPAYSFLYSSS